MAEGDGSDVDTVLDEVARRIVLAEGHRDQEALHRAYSWLRLNKPLAHVNVAGHPAFWLVSKHADVRAVGRDPKVFSSAGIEPGRFSQMMTSEAGEDFLRSISGESGRMLDTLTAMDPPEHTDIKRIASDWFRPANIDRWEAAIRGVARQLIARRLRRGIQEVDVANEFSKFYPLLVIMSLVGIPRSDEPRMMALTQELFGRDETASDPEVPAITPDVAARRITSEMQEFFSYFDEFVVDRRRTPRGDLATVISSARDSAGKYYDKKYAFGWFIGIATAGHDTTSTTLTGIMEALARRPDQLTAVRANPGHISDLVNEGLRWVSPVKHFVRQATCDSELSGERIRRGDRLALLYPSANRDEEVFNDPFTFRFDRRPNPHIAFGHGPHMCIGQHLAKLELRVMLEELLPRITSLEVAGEPISMQSAFVGGLRNLHVALEMT